MQSRQLQGEYYGVPNHDDATYSEMYERYLESCRTLTASKDGQPSPVDTASGLPILVKALFIRVGQVSGELPADFLEADICFCDESGRIINSMTRSLSTPITDELRPAVDRMKLGQSTSDDDNQIARAILDSPQCFALAV